MCIYKNSVCMLFTLTISILTQCLPQIWNKFTLIITPPNLGQICFEPCFMWMMLSYNLSQGSRRITLYRLKVQSINNSFSSNWVQGIIHSSTWSAFLAKWLSQSNMTFIILNFMHLIHTSEIHTKIILNDSRFSQNLRITLSPGYG